MLESEDEEKYNVVKTLVKRVEELKTNNTKVDNQKITENIIIKVDTVVGSTA